MFERFDERACQAVVLAGIEARDRRFSHVGTESLLVGLLLEADTRTGTMAEYEAAEERAERVSPAHILLAASRVGEGEGLRALEALQISPDDLRARLYG